MRTYTDKINKEMYNRAMANNGVMTNEDMNKFFNPCLLWGYGVYGVRVFEENGEYFVKYETGSTCD